MSQRAEHSRMSLAEKEMGKRKNVQNGVCFISSWYLPYLLIILTEAIPMGIPMRNPPRTYIAPEIHRMFAKRLLLCLGPLKNLE